MKEIYEGVRHCLSRKVSDATIRGVIYSSIRQKRKAHFVKVAQGTYSIDQ